MPQPFCIHFPDQATKQEIVVNGEIPDPEWKKLLRFMRYADDLTLILRDGGLNVKYRIQWDAEKGVSSESVVPPEITTRAFLHSMRPFVLQGEDTYCLNICSILTRYFTHPRLRRLLQRLREKFLGEEFQSQLMIEANGVRLNSERTLTKWLNAFEYHRDITKQEEMEALHQILPLQNSKAIYLSMMLDKASVVLELARLVWGLERRQGTQVTFQP